MILAAKKPLIFGGGGLIWSGASEELKELVNSLGVAESVNALKDHKIDAFFWVGGLPTAAVTDLGATPGVKIKLIDHAEAVAKMNAKYGNRKLLPSSPEGMANANRWMDWQLSTFNATIVPLFWNLVRTPPDKRDPKAVQAALEKTGKAWQLVEKQLAQHRFLAGEEFFRVFMPLTHIGRVCPAA